MSNLLVLGATGFLGKRLCRKLDSLQMTYHKASYSLGTDLRDAAQTLTLFERLRPEYVLNCAAYVKGLQFGIKYPVEMFVNNLLMTIQILEACQKYSVRRLVNPITNCAYPSAASLCQNFNEGEFWNGPLHETVMVFGMARKMSWVGAYAYGKQYGLDTLNLIFSNMYGPEDHFDEERSHALGALIKKFADAKINGSPHVEVWGTGAPVREWLHVDDAAEAMVRALAVEPHPEPINIGIGQGISIKDMAFLIKKHTGYEGEVVFNSDKPEGAPYKTLDGTKGEQLFGWRPQIEFEEGVKATVDWYLRHHN